MIPEDTPEDRARDERNVRRHAELAGIYMDLTAADVMLDIYLLSQIAMFKLHMEALNRDVDANLARANREVDEALGQPRKS